MNEVPSLFLPGVPNDQLDAEVDRLSRGGQATLVYSITCRHDDRVIEATVGQPRLERRIVRPMRQGGDLRMPRERIATAQVAGTPVYAIVVRARTVELHETPGPSATAKPAVFSRTEIHKTVPFTAPGD